MESSLIRRTFFEFFKSKSHRIVKSAPMVLKDDPTLMFTNAGMNQFKDFFLGNHTPKDKRVANTQKCLRVSGKHNDLEEVGVDTYHHTMFEMLGNWSFGDYFKEEAIQWAYELLVDHYKINKGNLYVTFFSGDRSDGLEADEETKKLWLKYFPEDRVLGFGKKDNFWEMGETGPCGPCSEIHIDIRSDEDKQKTPGAELVNTSHPEVIEVWNLVFIQYSRKKDGSLVTLPKKHVDTGMGLERLTMVLQGKTSNYETDLFIPLINQLEGSLSGIRYEHGNSKEDIAFRVVVDHLRAVSVSIAEGQLPFNTGAGYVIRRILRRAIRYAYSFLGIREPIIFSLVPKLSELLGEIFPELKKQQDLIQKVIREEEENFLRTLQNGIDRFETYLKAHKNVKQVDGAFAFELFDTYGFPYDLTLLMAKEKGIEGGIDEKAFRTNLEKQKERSRQATRIDAGDWQVLVEDEKEEFIGYDHLEADIRITRYRKVRAKNKDLYHLVFNLTPFYPEGGGQVGDTGMISNKDEQIDIINTVKENNLIIHISEELPADLKGVFKASVNVSRRKDAMRNHSATHLLHEALREILGDHIEQKGSLVHPDYLRFDFSHFEKISEEDLGKIEEQVNRNIREALPLEEDRTVPFQEAVDRGAMALFGEKYGDEVRVIQFGNSVELCGGTHVPNTAQIGRFKILSEGSISAGIRRIEAVTGRAADKYFNDQIATLESVREILKNPKDPVAAVSNLLKENQQLQRRVEKQRDSEVRAEVKSLESKIETVNGVEFLAETTPLWGDEMRDAIFQLRSKHKRLFAVLAAENDGKVIVSVGVGDDLKDRNKFSAKDFVREISGLIKGGGGGQDHFATAGGKEKSGIQQVFEAARSITQA